MSVSARSAKCAPLMAGEVGSSVTLLSNGFQPEYELGFANGLAVNGQQVVLVGSDRTLLERLDKRVVLKNLRRSQDPSRSRSTKVRNVLGYWWRLGSMLRKERPPLVHVIGLFTLRAPIAAFLEAWVLTHLTKRWILTVHNLLPHDRHTWLNRAIYRRLYRLPQLLVVHTERMRDQLESEFGLSRSRIQVVAHGVDSSAQLPHTRAWMCC
jgi:glycosyltransferase involved in cell wall biosynthesis